MAYRVCRPQIPYIGAIPGGVDDGLQIHMSVVPKGGFLISLQRGKDTNPRSDCAFLFSPRFEDYQVVRSSMQDGVWNEEERNGGFPFQLDQPCRIVIDVQPSHYSVYVNDKLFCIYNHRIQRHRVTHISVEQGIHVELIEFRRPQDGKGALPGPGRPLGYPMPDGASIYNPVVPYKTNVGGLYHNRMIYISGIPHPNQSRFSVSFHAGEDVAFHFDVRYDQKKIVRSAKQGADWGIEETDLRYFPFQPDKFFEMIILVEANCFKVAVNDQHLLEFIHRIQALQSIDTLRIEGDLRLTHVRF